MRGRFYQSSHLYEHVNSLTSYYLTNITTGTYLNRIYKHTITFLSFNLRRVFFFSLSIGFKVGLIDWADYVLGTILQNLSFKGLQSCVQFKATTQLLTIVVKNIVGSHIFSFYYHNGPYWPNTVLGKISRSDTRKYKHTATQLFFYYWIAIFVIFT